MTTIYQNNVAASYLLALVKLAFDLARGTCELALPLEQPFDEISGINLRDSD